VVTNSNVKSVAKVKKEAAPKENVLLATAEDVKLNSSFESNRHNLPWPVDKGYVLYHYGMNELPNGLKINSQGLTIGSDIGTTVRAIFDGEVVAVNNIDDVQMIVIKHGRYFTGYNNLSGVSVSKGQNVRTGQSIGRVAPNLDGIGSVDLLLSNDTSDLDPEAWLKRK